MSKRSKTKPRDPKAKARKAMLASLPQCPRYWPSFRRLYYFQETAFAAWARTLSDKALEKIVAKEASKALVGKLNALNFLHDPIVAPDKAVAITQPEAFAFAALKELTRRKDGREDCDRT